MMVSYSPLPIPVSVEAHLIINSIVLAVTITVVALRIISRKLAGTKLGWDDYLTLLSVPQAVGMLVLQGLCMFPNPLGGSDVSSCVLCMAC